MRQECCLAEQGTLGHWRMKANKGSSKSAFVIFSQSKICPCNQEQANQKPKVERGPAGDFPENGANFWINPDLPSKDLCGKADSRKCSVLWQHQWASKQRKKSSGQARSSSSFLKCAWKALPSEVGLYQFPRQSCPYCPKQAVLTILLPTTAYPLFGLTLWTPNIRRTQEARVF